MTIPDLPGLPSLSATPQFSTSGSLSDVSLTWTQTGTSPTSYELQRSSNGGATWVIIATPSSDSTSYTDTAVTTESIYLYQLTAVNAAGDSATATASANGATNQVLPPADIQISWQPGADESYQGESNELTVSWTNQDPDVAYTVIQWTDPTGYLCSEIADGASEQLVVEGNGSSSSPSDPGTWQFSLWTVASDGDSSAPVDQPFSMPYLPPIAHGDTYWAMHGQPTTLDVLDNDVTDPQTWNGKAIDTLAVYSQPANGHVAVVFDSQTNRDTLVYTSNPGYRGLDTFQYQAENDHEVLSQPATITINVSETPPIAFGSWASLGYDYSTSTWTVSGQMVGFDPDQVPLIYTVESDPTNVLSFNYDPTDGGYSMTFTGAYPLEQTVPTFTFTCSDGLADSNTATAAGDLWSPYYQYYSYFYEGAIVLPGGNYSAKLFIPSGCQYASIDQPQQHGSLTVNADGSFTYCANSDFTGDDWFTYTVTDYYGDSYTLPFVFGVQNAIVGLAASNDGGSPWTWLGYNGYYYGYGGEVWSDSPYASTPTPEFGWGPYGTWGWWGWWDWAPYSDSYSDRDVTDWSSPGKIVPVDSAVNADEVPGFADGYGQFGNSDYVDEQSQLVPFYITLPSGFDMTNGLVRIQYSDSNPAEVTRSGSGTTLDPYQYALPGDGGALRIWTSNGQRSADGVSTSLSSGSGRRLLRAQRRIQYRRLGEGRRDK